MRNPRFSKLTITVLATVAVAGGQEPGKSAYNLFHPTPRDQMREMSTDRPDQTESPFTVDAGHLQVEMDLGYAEFTRSHSGGADQDSTTWGVIPVNLKLGLLDNVDVQFLVNPYLHSRVEGLPGGAVAAAGFGDVLTRVKVNFWGNNGGRTAFAIMPFVKWPLPQSGLRNGTFEGGVIFPFAVDLGGGWSLGAMTEYDFVSADSGRRVAQFVNSVAVGRSVTSKLGVYAEFYARSRRERDFRWQGQADTGWTYALGPNLQLDAGCNFGVTASAPDFRPFIGLSFRR